MKERSNSKKMLDLHYVSYVYDSKGRPNALKSVQIFDRGAWSLGPDLPLAVFNAPPARISPSEIALFGGYASRNLLDSVIIFNQDKGSYETSESGDIGSLPHAVYSPLLAEVRGETNVIVFTDTSECLNGMF